MTIDEEFDFKLLTQESLQKNTHDFDQVFELWYNSYSDNYTKWGMESPLYSDSLYKQHEILALFHQQKAIAMVCHRYVNLKQKALYYESYFEDCLWTPEAKVKLQNMGERGVLGSHIVVHPEYRKLSSGKNIKTLITFLSFRHLLEKNVDVITGNMRTDKGMEKLFYDCGARTLLRDRMYHGTPVHVVIFEPQKIPIQIPDEFLSTVNKIYEKLINQGDEFYERKVSVANQRAV